MNIELVEWVDSTGFSGWNKIEDVRELEALKCRSVGYVVHETDAALYLSPTLDGQTGTSLRVMDAVAIPKVAIVSREVVRHAHQAITKKPSTPIGGPKPSIEKGLYRV